MTDRARDLLARAPVIDGHNDLLWEAREKFGYDFDRLDIASPRPHGTATPLPRPGHASRDRQRSGDFQHEAGG